MQVIRRSRVRSRFARVAAALALVLPLFTWTTGDSSAAPAPLVLPDSLTGSISWEYANGVSGQFGYKDYDLSETFTWSGALANQTPGPGTSARYLAKGGSFGYGGDWTYVTTISNCDQTTTVTRTHGSNAASFDQVELLVYLDAPAHAVLKAQCSTSEQQHSEDCHGSASDSSFDGARTIAHGDSGNTGTVKFLPKGKIEVTFDLTAGTKTGRPYEYERIVAKFVLTVPCKVDLDAKGVPDADEESVGALVVKQSAEVHPERLPVTLRRVKGITDDLILKRTYQALRVFTAKKGGTEILFDGTDNRFANAKLPKTLYVEGKDHSNSMRDVQLSLESVADPQCRDVVKFTVLWAEIDQFNFDSDATYFPDDTAADPWIASTLDFHLGFHRLHKVTTPFRIDEGAGWITETRALVHPNDFDYPGVKVAIFHESEARTFALAPGSVKHEASPLRRHSDIVDKGGYVLASAQRDDVVDADGMIYAVNGVAAKAADALPAGWVSRYRGNFEVGVLLLYSRKKAVPCADASGFYIVFSVLYPAGGGTPTLIGDVPNDNKAFGGTATALSWNLN